MFRNLTRFDALLGFGGYTHCTQIRGGLSKNFVGFRRALVLGKLYSQLYAHECYQQTFESPCHWSVCSHGQCFHFLPIIFLPNIYWTKRTGGPLVLLWFHAPEYMDCAWCGSWDSHYVGLSVRGNKSPWSDWIITCFSKFLPFWGRVRAFWPISSIIPVQEWTLEWNNSLTYELCCVLVEKFFFENRK